MLHTFNSMKRRLFCSFSIIQYINEGCRGYLVFGPQTILGLYSVLEGFLIQSLAQLQTCVRYSKSLYSVLGPMLVRYSVPEGSVFSQWANFRPVFGTRIVCIHSLGQFQACIRSSKGLYSVLGPILGLYQVIEGYVNTIRYLVLNSRFLPYTV